MADDDALTRRGMLVLLGSGGLMAGVAMSQLGDTEQPARPFTGAGGAQDGPRLVAAVTAASRSRRPARAGAVHAAHAADDAGGTNPEHDSWSDVVRVRLRVQNVTDHAVLLSPGQFRLRVEALGLTVMPLAAGRPVGPLGAGAASETWIDYLAPPEAQDLSLEFTDLGRSEAVSLTVLTADGGLT